MNARAWFFRVCLGMSLVALSSPSSTVAQTSGPDIVVSIDPSVCPNAQFTSIQQAVNAAAPGDLIEVCAGVYNEQVVIQKSIRLEGDNGAIIQPNPMSSNGTGVVSGEAVAAVILAENASNVLIQGFIVDGTFNNLAGCSPTLFGILFQNASGVVTHNAVKHMRLSTVLDGCQSGNGIDVESQGGTSTVSISANSVHGYQKNGITGNEVGTSVTIQGNSTTAPAPTSGAAPNGIQIGFGATGTIARNNVADHVWTPCVSVDDCTADGTGILIFQSNGITISQNTVGVNQIGIGVIGDNATLSQNNVFDSKVLWGVALQGDNNLLQNSAITHSTNAGVFVAGSNNTVQQNRITDAGIGVLEASGTSGNTVANNTFFDIAGALVQTPTAAMAAQTKAQPSIKVQPMR